MSVRLRLGFTTLLTLFDFGVFLDGSCTVFDLTLVS